MADLTLVVPYEDFRLLEKYDDVGAAVHITGLHLEYWVELTEDRAALLTKVLPYFTSLERLVLDGDTSEVFLTVMKILVVSKIQLTALDTGDLKWSCFTRLSGFKQVFKNLKTLKIGFDDSYDEYTLDSIVGLRVVLGWASGVAELKCGMHWGVTWDEVASEQTWPNLKSLDLGPCESTTRFLQSFFKKHPAIEFFCFKGYITNDRDDKNPISLSTATTFVSSPTFNGVNVTISQDEFAEWKDIQIVSQDGKVRKRVLRLPPEAVLDPMTASMG